MNRPRRVISHAAREHIEQANRWRATAAMHKRGAAVRARNLTLQIRQSLGVFTEMLRHGTNPKYLKGPVRRDNVAHFRTLKDLRQAVHKSEEAREHARAHIGAAKVHVERANPTAKKTGRRYRHF